MKQVKYYEMGYSEAEKLIENNYGFEEFCIPDAEQKSNDCALIYNLDGVVDKWNIKDIEDRNYNFMTRTYLNDLCRQGILKKGKYLINIS